jgi:hypothetical protein
MRSSWSLIGCTFLLPLAAGCSKCSAQHGESASSPAPPTARSASPSEAAPAASDGASLALATMSDDPGRCVEQIVVGGLATCFVFNRGYTWCQGGTSLLGYEMREPPYYVVIPRRYEQLYLGGQLNCGRTSAGGIECWGRKTTRDILPDQSGPAQEPVPMTNLPARVDSFSVEHLTYCASSGNRVVCPFRELKTDVRGLGNIRQMGTGIGFGCASSEERVWCWHVSIGSEFTRPQAPWSCPDLVNRFDCLNQLRDVGLELDRRHVVEV